MSDPICVRPDTLDNIDIVRAESHFRSMMIALGLDVEHPHLRETPRRVVAMYREMFFDKPWNFTTFEVEGDPGIVIVRDISFTSLCAHHLSPFSGKATIAYIPDRKLVGLSKLPRALGSFAKGPNVQELIGMNTADFLMEKLEPKGVAVIITAEHTCMTIRGAKAHGSITTTSALRGCFLDEPSARAELTALLHA